MAASLALAALALTACKGGDVTTYRLEKDAGSLSSLATDGSVLATATARGETTSAYTHVHAGELGNEVAQLADVLGSATPEAPVRAPTNHLIRLARDAAAALERLEDDPASDAVAQAAGARLARIATAAAQIEKRA